MRGTTPAFGRRHALSHRGPQSGIRAEQWSAAWRDDLEGLANVPGLCLGVVLAWGPSIWSSGSQIVSQPVSVHSFERLLTHD